MSDFYKFFIIPVAIDCIILLVMYIRRKNQSCDEDDLQQQGGCATTIALTIVIFLALVAIDTLINHYNEYPQ